MSAFDAAQATNAVGLDLYRQLSDANPGGNLVLSPYSIESALALAYAGTARETRTEMARALRLPAEDDALATGFNLLRESLDEVVQQSQKESESMRRYGGHAEPLALYVASRLYGQAGYAFRDSYLALLRDRFLAPFEPADFLTDPETVRTDINRWVSTQTRDRIKDLIPPQTLSRDSRLVLINALYIKAAWAAPFSERSTRPRPFHLADASTREIPTMNQMGHLGYAQEGRLTLVSIGYTGSGLQFLVILPDTGVPLSEAAAQLSAERLAGWRKLPEAYINLSLPKFRVDDASISLTDSLKAMGIRRAFDLPRGNANFDRIAPRKANDYLFISEVLHKTFIAVDEKGTEAAAATAIAMAAGGMAQQPKPVEVRVDRPFLFAIQDTKTGLCLFFGRIADPR
ncbi:MAG: serpin family protein [Verrucomicrobiota bacterium]